jgi:hypothetical protein
MNSAFEHGGRIPHRYADGNIPATATEHVRAIGVRGRRGGHYTEG